MAAEAERVVQRDVDTGFLRNVRDEVQIEAFVGVVEVDRRGKDALVDRHDGRNRLDSARGAKRVAGHRLG